MGRGGQWNPQCLILIVASFFLQLQSRVKGKQSKALQMIVFTCSNCCLREKRKKERSRGKVGGEKEGKRKVCARGLPAQLHFPPPVQRVTWLTGSSRLGSEWRQRRPLGDTSTRGEKDECFVSILFLPHQPLLYSAIVTFMKMKLACLELAFSVSIELVS